ncbi:MFS transporter [Amantichitinum ursilacus]|uniref:Lysophospholipid transporter LplT n=1 Tax=Amantichitinum ursilacus TaxID=857265 RepID=A0A0N0XN08_9NEIS|nr:MFS transporter [Amantichitinum ursilacus]KPC55255.1 Lysophospholipid transporter LplT [Amantichitinum ursilacus]
MQSHNQFSLFGTRRFLPLFITQFFGAFNDNLFKNAFLVMIVYAGLSAGGMDSQTLIGASAGIFILPFFLFSAVSGQLAEKFDKARMARAVKLLEVLIMLAAGYGFWQHNAYVLLGCLFMMGVHSTLFGPLKYSVLPQYLQPRELMAGNGLIEGGTFIAILLGQIAGTVIVQHQPHGETMIIWACVAVAVIGLLASRSMPPAPAPAPDLKISWNVLGETWRIINFSRQNKTVFNSLLGLSWFWFVGAIYLTYLPEMSKVVLHGDASVYTLLITLFSVGIGAGSVLCDKLSGHKIEVGLVPFGSMGLSAFGIDLYFALGHSPLGNYDWISFLRDSGHWRVMFDLALLGVFGGFYTVPLYALIQTRSDKRFVSRAIAANNILNSLFMVVASAMGIALIKAGLSIPALLLTVALLNVLVAIYIYTLIPEFLMRFLVWILIGLLYRIKERGLENIPDEGPCVLICNHVSFMDAMVIAGTVRRPVRFVMDHRIFKIPVLNFIFRVAGAIPIAPAKEDPTLKDKAFDRVAQYLAEGEVVCIFPEGAITRDGEIRTFRPGIEEIIKRTPVPVIPIALQGLWGSFFSRKDGAAMMKMPRRFWSRIGFNVGAPVPAEAADRMALEARVRELRGDWK